MGRAGTRASRDWYGSEKYLDALGRYVDFQKVLGDEQRALIYEYFQTGYAHINPVLRRGGPAAQSIAPLVSALSAALVRAPRFVGTVWRGLALSAQDLAAYQPGSEITWTAFSSTSLDQGVAERFATPQADMVPVVMELHSKSCIDARGASHKLNEAEILCLPGTRVRVVRKDAPNRIVLDEVAVP